MFRKVAQPFYTLYVIIVFAATILIIVPFILVFGFGDNIKSRKIIYYIIKYWSKTWLWLIGMPLEVHGPRPPECKYVVVANHISYIDSIALLPSIPGYFRPLGKKEISKIPIIGFIYKKIVIMVDRSSHHSRVRSMRLMWRVLKHDGNIAIFPEGTFNETGRPLKEFFDGAFRLAINANVSILPIIFLDTVDRWHYSGWWKIWPGKNRAVYLPPISTDGMGTANLKELKQQVYTAMETALMDAKKDWYQE